ncbi:hypothetical protein ASPFODRAFT_54946 [Aspergillus luchuensis CBS 106.47]|uniref:DUF7587 domain-containing protein n=1 Tax=Aspergillus luchuensis (strain CBS 106.47) TaxID=1137211 RepID=A0A1M3SYR2_ASPLC|nr:hypothetical protein ASPFODRAFT_54946 [Aspergillus luchuensis CBS 106.47]
MNTIPPFFYRVQHDRSYTIFDPQTGFESNGHYSMPYSFWLNKGKVESHSDWQARPIQPTPFISVFDDRAKADERLKHHRCQSDTGIILATIDTSSLSPTIIDIYFANNTTVRLSAWENNEGTTFVSTQAFREHLRVQTSISQASEWFALDCMPLNMICQIEAY